MIPWDVVQTGGEACWIPRTSTGQRVFMCNCCLKTGSGKTPVLCNGNYHIMWRESCTLKDRKNQYMSRYTKMNNVKMVKIPMNMKCLPSVKNLINQCRSVLALQEHLPHLSLSINQVFHQIKLEILLQGTCKCLTITFLCRQPTMGWHTQANELFVKKAIREFLLL